MNAKHEPTPTAAEVFNRALEIADLGQRETYLDKVCTGKEALRQEVERLLAHHKADSFMERPAGQYTIEFATNVPQGEVPELPVTLKYFGDYELLEEIARGGMGVVWKARQKSLNRLVAVKMILSGQLATAADVKRFHTEAEAAANLQHPNIVAIHEIGEQAGRHYFSMDYVAGRDLAEVIKEKPIGPTEAAKLLQTIAEAVHYAHQRGTLHRDLKPHNVLIDESGAPRITDFGLAKQMTNQSELTHSGTVMGSPSYMPPEQALGRLGELGPASDVYSLGAILYQMLTGRVPFQGATAVETLQQVVEQEPAAPTKLNPAVPPDLETICLKCLEKKSERRYASARALAEELGRFLKHEPILAKPASTARKLVSWCRQRPWVVSGLAVLLVLGLTGLAFGLWQKSEFLQWRMANPKAKVPGELMRAPVFLLLTGMVLWIVSVLCSVHWSEVKRQRLAPIPPWLNRFVKVTGTIQVLLSVGLALSSIRLLVWFTSQDHREAWLGLTNIFFAIAFCWTGLLVTWRFARLDELLGVGLQEREQPKFKLKVNWPGMLVLIPLLLLANPPMVRWFLEWGQFQPLPGMFPGAEEPIVLDPIMRKRVDDNFAQLFGLVAGVFAQLVYFAGIFFKRPRDEWRDLTPPIVFIGLGACLGFLMLLPLVIAAVAVLSGALAGIALLKVAGLRRIEPPTETDPSDWSVMLNQPAYKRTLPWVFLGMVLPPFLLGLGKVQDQAYLALTWFALANLIATAGQLRTASRNTWCYLALSCFIVLYFLTEGFTRTFLIPNIFTNLLLLIPPIIGGYFLDRAMKKT
jgi:serine/threonine protein kinase